MAPTSAPAATVARKAREREVAVASTCSVRPSCSSPRRRGRRPRSPKQVMTTADDREHGREQRVLQRARRRRCSRSPGGPPRCRAGRRRSGAMAPITSAQRGDAGGPAEQRRCGAPARSSASASASRGEPCAGPGRAGEQAGAEVAAAPQRRAAATQRGRRGRRTAAAPTSAARDHARSRVDQPNGVSQRQPRRRRCRRRRAAA